MILSPTYQAYWFKRNQNIFDVYVLTCAICRICSSSNHWYCQYDKSRSQANFLVKFSMVHFCRLSMLCCFLHADYILEEDWYGGQESRMFHPGNFYHNYPIWHMAFSLWLLLFLIHKFYWQTCIIWIISPVWNVIYLNVKTTVRYN